jgi:hypothetical protein
MPSSLDIVEQHTGQQAESELIDELLKMPPLTSDRDT